MTARVLMTISSTPTWHFDRPLQNDSAKLKPKTILFNDATWHHFIDGTPIVNLRHLNNSPHQKGDEL